MFCFSNGMAAEKIQVELFSRFIDPLEQQFANYMTKQVKEAKIAVDLSPMKI